LRTFYGNENFGARVAIKAGSSQIEPGVTPAKDVVLSWKTLSDAADEAGISRRYGGIHFWNGDQQGRVLGRLISYNDWNLAQNYFNGNPTTTTTPWLDRSRDDFMPNLLVAPRRLRAGLLADDGPATTS
jgi:hypothetical protein